MRSVTWSSDVRKRRWWSSSSATKRNGCSTPSVGVRIGVRISAIPRTGPEWVRNATSTKEPFPSECGICNSPPVTEIVWSLASAHWPSSKRIAASTESASWTRAERREGCGWGKWVISHLYYGRRTGAGTRLRKQLAGFPCPERRFSDPSAAPSSPSEKFTNS